jgi:benzoyl-CoA reductase/2-hydroxyglutaryl-CoA dehydratase subunit BcrC/BadD/HgdB
LFFSSIQLNELTQTNNILQNKHDEMRKTYELKLFDQSSILEHDNLQQENQLFRNAIDQWSNRYEELRLKLEQLTKYSLFTLLN